MKSKAASPPVPPKRISLVAQTAQSLREGIRKGCWRGRLPGERELCEQLQVGRRTLRAALQELQRQGWLHVEPRQRRRIRARGSSRSADPLRKVIAVLSPCSFMELAPPMMFVLDVLRSRVAAAGGTVEFHASRPCFSARPDRALEALVRRHPAAAWLVVGSKEPMQRWFMRRRLPCLVMGSCAADLLPSLDLDHRAICRHAGGVLWRKGHKRLVLVLPLDAYGGDIESEAGLEESVRGLPGAQLRVLRHDGSREHLSLLLDQTLSEPQPPTAYLVAGAKPLLTVITHLARRGIRIPQDAAVICRDDEPYLQAISPAVAHYAINRTHVARRLAVAARQLAQDGALAARAIRLMPTFVSGETV